MSLILDEHREYLADGPRLDAFARALGEVVRPGDVVLDLASGTGILGYLALQAGAARVYAVDDGPIIDVARRFAAANGYADRVTFLREFSTRVTLPELADVVVCDQIGHLGVEAGVFEFLLDAERRLLKPGARAVPGGIRFEVAGLESDELRRRLDFWETRPAGLDVRVARETAFNTGYPFAIAPSQLLTAPSEAASATLPPATLAAVAGETERVVTRRGRLDGIGAWFVAELAPGVTMTNGPRDPHRINRRQVMLPIERPVDVEPGDRVTIRLHMLPRDAVVTWQVTVRRREASLATSRHSTFRGMLLSDEERARTAPDLRPELTEAGRARRTVLELCDGRTVREIEQGTFERHPALFPGPAEAAVFVAEVLTRYAR